MNFREQINQLNEQLRQLGLQSRITLSIEIPMIALLVDQEPPPLPPVKPQATMKTVLWCLNQLHAAPGQPNRDIVRLYLFHRGWIEGSQECEAWHLGFVPTSRADLQKLHSEIQQFEQDQKKPKPQ